MKAPLSPILWGQALKEQMEGFSMKLSRMNNNVKKGKGLDRSSPFLGNSIFNKGRGNTTLIGELIA